MSIVCTVAKIRAKNFFCRRWNWFYSICRSFLSTLVVVLRWLHVLLPRYRQTCVFADVEIGLAAFAVWFWAFCWLFCVGCLYRCKKIWEKTFLRRLRNQFYSISRSLFSILVIVLRRSDVPFPRYEQNRFFADFEISFTAFAVHFWALWWLFSVDRMYHCQDTDENVSLPTIKLVLRHLPFVFENFGGCFVLIGRSIDKIFTKMFLRWL